MPTWFERFRRWRTLPRENRRLALECVAELAVARVCLLIRPFKKVVASLGEMGVEPSDEGETPEIARVTGRALRRCGRVVWWRGECLEQAIAGARMLRRRGIPSTITLGVRRGDDDGKLEAHAWLRCGTEIVVGQAVEGESDFSPILWVNTEGKTQ